MSVPAPISLALVLASIVLLGGVTGCVTQGTYDAVVQERDTLLAKATTLTEVAISLDNDVLTQEFQIAQLRREQKELADEVARWALRGAIQMQLLSDGLHLILPQDVLFASGTATLSPQGEEMIVDLVKEIAPQPYQIAVLGFSDDIPVGEHLVERYPSNWELSGARATSVVRIMEREGLPPAQLMGIAKGETEPVAPNDTPEGRAENRRIDIRIRPIVKR
jgi:chemotaxis protein MotB